MKMENLLKCEQVLVNLYAKVEQRDALPEPKINDSSTKEKSDLNIVRNKLKSVVSKLHSDPVETLPEIARASETEEVCVPGSKEPALFQRRPNKPSVTPTRLSPSRNNELLSKRNYTRVLLSPEPSEKIWPTDIPTSDKPLFSRRSPKKSPRKHSPSYKKERKKYSKKNSKCIESKDLNITLNVPEDSLNSLNTKDILSRIINCSDSDVDIATLRELRTQILGELKETGANDDISDLILKSYKKKEKVSKNTEVEEGELSDSESEAIESIYGSLVVLDKNKSLNTGNKNEDKEKARKIQICLVINSDKTKPISTKEEIDKISCVDTSDFETFNNRKDEKGNEKLLRDKKNSTSEDNPVEKSNFSQQLKFEKGEKNVGTIDLELEMVSPGDVDFETEDEQTTEPSLISSTKQEIIYDNNSLKSVEDLEQDNMKNEFKEVKLKDKLQTDINSVEKMPIYNNYVVEDSINETDVKIPLLEPTKQVSEIDILQALKKEILSETTNVLNTDSSSSSMINTPPLHQPKITKVANAQEIGSKKRISIESYKAKSSTPSKPTLNDNVGNIVKEDISRKQSLKLTEKECERFNFLSKLTLTESSDDEDKSSFSLDDIYTDMAPKSPDHEDFADTGLKPPVIIPSDPVQIPVVASDADVDMRKLLPNINSFESSTKPILSPLDKEKSQVLNFDTEMSKHNERALTYLADPRMKRDVNSGLNQDSSYQHSVNTENTQLPISNIVKSTQDIHNINVELTPALNINSNINRNFGMIPNSMHTVNLGPNVTLNVASTITQNVVPNMVCPLIPNMTPSRVPNTPSNLAPSITPNIPLLMTPSRTSNIGNMTPCMTPSRHVHESEDYPSHKHVYAPMFSVLEARDCVETPGDKRQMPWDTDSQSSVWEDRNTRNSSMQRDVDYRDIRNCAIQNDIDYRDQINSSIQRDIDYRDSRSHCIQRDIDYRGIRNNPVQSNQNFDSRDSDRIQFPTTPNHPFGRLDCPPTPTPSFGMLEMPMTPVHPFGRSDCPSTPSHPFGRVEPLLPLPHSFIRSEYNNQSIARSQDPRLNRSSDYDVNQYREDDRERINFQERTFNSGSYSLDHNNRHNNSELFRRYHRDQSAGRNERNNNFETASRNYRDQRSCRETSVGRSSFNRNERDNNLSFNREYEGDRYSRNRKKYGRGYDYRNHKDSKNYEEGGRRGYRRDRSVGRNIQSQERISDAIKDRQESTKISDNDKLYVHRHSGHSFTIDTSIKSTFQEMNTKQKSSFSFDARRQRASSVGRSLVSNSSTSRTSSRETKQIFYDTERKIRNVNFRRASSVGREIEDKKLDFNDIKADLKSFKFKSDFTFRKEKVDADGQELAYVKKNYAGTRKKSEEVSNKSTLKYSPRKNNRDPRVRREYTCENKNHSLDSKNYGIVYSNDNISKGTILGSGYGVKNYKIPKIRRPQDVTETSKPKESVNIGDNKSCSKNKSSDSKQQDVEMKSEFNIVEISDGKNDNTGSKLRKYKDFENLNANDKGLCNDDNKKSQKETQELLSSEQNDTSIDCSETENNDHQTNTFEKKNKSNKSHKGKSKDTKEFLDDDYDNDNEIQNEIDKNKNTMAGITLGSIEKRVTRSARKSMPEEPISLEISLIKRTRKSKKPLVLESDSDDNDKAPNTNTKSREPLVQNVISMTSENEAADLQVSRVEKIEDKNINTQFQVNNTKEHSQCMLLKNQKDESAIMTIEPNKQESSDVECRLLENTKIERKEKDLPLTGALDRQSKVQTEKDKKTEEDLDSSFGIVDLEMFSDNIISDPVIDNINALIADLDHDLDSSKSTDVNSHFTKELSMETMLENLRTPDKSEKKNVTDVSLPEQEVGAANKFKQVFNISTSAEDQIKNCVVKNNDNSTILKVDSYNEDNNLCSTKDVRSQQPENVQNISESDSRSEVLNSNSNKTHDVDRIEKVKFDQKCLEPSNPEVCTNTPVQKQAQSNEAYVEYTCSNDAIVSTSEDSNVYQSGITCENQMHNIDNSTSTPDSTINNNDNVESVESKSALPLNESSGCGMNSDVTSTHITDSIGKDPIEINSSDVGASTEIESIGKLLSILQDRTKIKELLSLLGEQTVENEKIKKKLEKLSEIVSDDELTNENKDAENLEDTYKDHSIKNSTQEQKAIYIKSNFESDIQDVMHQKETIVCGSNYEHANQEGKIAIKDNCEENMGVANNSFIANTNINNSEKILVSKEISQENIVTKDLSVLESDQTKIEEADKLEDQQNITIEDKKVNKTVIRKKPRKGKKRYNKKRTNIEDKRITRSDSSNLPPMIELAKPATKKPSRELKKLQEDIKEMFLKDDILSATGIRMCRIAKLVDETKPKDDITISEFVNQEPLVVLKKCNKIIEKNLKKKNTRIKVKLLDSSDSANKSVKSNLNKNETVIVPKTKLNAKSNLDPYDFETDSVNEPNISDNKNGSSSESESESLCSNKSNESTELQPETKKKVKRKRGRAWQAGIIKPKNKKKKIGLKSVNTATTSSNDDTETQGFKIPDFTCFTDRTYCFRKNVSTYNCRICLYNGTDIVHHYKKEHPHTEVPLSRMSPAVAKEAIKESDDENFQGISKISSKKYICRFCFEEFGRKRRHLETFFWHIVSMHTGEYKQTCSKCVNTQSCPLDIDIPPPPKDAKGQLLGYICEKCNYTQISLENLKTHVIVWHNDEQTAVYTVNLAFLSKVAIDHHLNRCDSSPDMDQLRVLRSSRSNQSMAEASDDESDAEESNENLNDIAEKITPHKTELSKPYVELSKTSNIQSKITFESDITDEISSVDTVSTIKVEPDRNEILASHCNDSHIETEKQATINENSLNIEKHSKAKASEDIFDYPHFKIKYTESGSKEYVCCINSKEHHYKTTLLISLKKHVQLKHSEKWDGYCCVCKVIVTPQGNHRFKDCLQHFLEKHIDNFPILGNEIQKQLPESNDPLVSGYATPLTNKTYINVRPLSELISNSCDSRSNEDNSPTLPVIESVISLGVQIDQPHPSPSYPIPLTENTEVSKEYKYEEFQAEVMSKKHRVVLEAMMSQMKLIQVFKCAGRFCSFTTDNAEDALLHASTHMRIGGIDSLNCVYCDFDSCGNAIDLITHVFKSHGCCPYVCGMCYYRAAASQQVNAHITRLHEKATNVAILKTPFQTSSSQDDDILSREAAVPYYQCCDQSGSDGPCKFRTYTPGKFCEHLQMRHASATEYLCYICSDSVPTAADLVCHLKTHGLKLYQCTWCVFGGDNEIEILAHASALHPAKQPKAYLRIITNKEGSSEFRVLPLAQLNKSEVTVTEVTPNNQKDFPVREAERSIELEKLIGHTTLMIESMTKSTETDASEKEQNAQIESVSQLEQPLLENLSVLETAQTQIPRMRTPSPSAEIIDQSDNQVTPIIKAETLDITPEKIPEPAPDIVCLDSDDESPEPTVQNIPDIGTSTLNVQAATITEIKKVQLTQLFLCTKCKMIVKCGSGFKKHINACFAYTSDPIPCAHCPMLITKKNIVSHYNLHCDRSKEKSRYFCEKCVLGFNTLAQSKEHQLTHHSVSKPGGSSFPPTGTEVLATRGRRKRSLESRDKAIEPPNKVKRYGPQDIDKLPINPILDDSVHCSLCEFSTKVRLNMVRHLQFHAEQQPVPQTAPVNPVPHLETNEKHFDKMLNLASSSIVNRQNDKNSKFDTNNSVTLCIPPEAISRYPKLVPDKQRLTCGAKGCSYISVDETMLKCHWETLHSGTNDFHCAHCPPYQNLDRSKPVTASRIIAHLKMHDEKLYACSMCSYYHYRRQILEKHLAEVHKGGGQVMIVRETTVGESSTSVSATQMKTSAPTMDLKPWQCGLCRFKSLLRPEVAEHCAKVHNSKMQFKCAYCAFRTSNPENITKHQNKSHTNKPEEIFYYYYREGSVPDNPDGTACWQKQSQNSVVSEPKVKSEDPSDISSDSTLTQNNFSPPTSINPIVDLNLVKKETIEPVTETIEDLCKDFGQFCEPNGLKYKCSLCNNVIEDTLEAMQSHLYEELKYRKWGCSICSYKAFHKEGLNEHMHTEHRQNREPIALPVDNRVETWVAKLLEHQTAKIMKYKENLAIQKVEILRVTPGPSISKPQPQQVKESSSTHPSISSSTNKPNMAELEKIFGTFGVSENLSFCCPKCKSLFKEEDAMKSHLESEQNKIRWFCNKCSMNFQTYHEAQFHCRSVHIGQSARPVEVTRDATVRLSWIEAVIKVQKLSMELAPQESIENNSPSHSEDVSEESENSLLVVRYEKNIPTPEEVMARKTPAPAVDSDDEKLVIDEPLENRKAKPSHKCPHCTYVTGNEKLLQTHILRHYGLKPYTCPYCGLNGARKTIEKHQKTLHSTMPINLVNATVPNETPDEYSKKFSSSPSDTSKVVCLVCRNYFTEIESHAHTHDKMYTAFGKRGEVVVQCSVCFTLYKDVTGYLKHHRQAHPELTVNYVFSKLNTVNVESKGLLYACGMCPQKFSNMKDIRTHVDANHQSILKYTLVPKYNIPIIDLDEYEEQEDVAKRKNDDASILPPSKRIARKSTTKLPNSKPFAKKSTTKLPFNVPDDSKEYSYYGTKPSNEHLELGVMTMMPFCNKMVPFTLKRLREIINIDPVVIVEKLIFD